ncbi:cytochrome c [Pseudomonas sp. FP1154]|jgi:mono/diheme cytochrome c family protein|uniref:c-type cytochrome n=1 Tax=unclassified Pseudomonas TaxID=196821 RepID=UPI00136BB34F|nr:MULTISPECIES: cytochrome c [unclassified Pseudomonas]MXR30598.1 c-type cytochrome [Pseudomonas sp. PICF6]WLG25481.1 cytochrome c [Pseudomonas sp. FP1154]
MKGSFIRARPLWISAVVLASVGAIGAVMLMWRPAIAPIERPRTFDSAQLQRGARVVEAGDCAVCHTRPGGQYMAGGLPLRTPFGTLYSTNITADPQTGIGQWSLPAFERAMREGISRDGHFLYPAFPYVHYRRMTTDDIADAYAYLMSGPAVDSPAMQNNMNFPMNIRPLVSFWNLLFLHAKPLTPVARQSEAWNRGRYLVQGPGHCAGCHSPLNLLGAQKSGESLAGGSVEGWQAPSLLGMARRANAWSTEQLVRYLRAEIVEGHGTAAGPMRAVSLGLARMPVADAEAIAEYLLSLPGRAVIREIHPDAASAEPTAQASGALLFASACAGCHGAAAPMREIDGRPALNRTSALQASSARNFLKTVLDGIPATPGVPGPVMPPFAASLDNAQLSALASYLRHQASPDQPWTDLSATLEAIRQETK